MGDLTSWLMSMVGPVVKKVLTTIGLGWLTFEGVTGLADQVRNSVLGSFGGTAGVVYDLLALAGFIDSVGIILGAISMVAGLAALGKLGRVLA